MKVEKSHYTIEEIFGDLIAKRGMPSLLLEGLRHREGLTQMQFADALEINTSSLDQMERGTRKISNMTALKLQKLFNLSDELIKSFLG